MRAVGASNASSARWRARRRRAARARPRRRGARARRAAVPPTRSAECIGGRCWMVPTKPGRAPVPRRSAKHVRRLFPTSPCRSASSESVVTPRRSSASYSLSPLMRNGTSLVASPTQMGRTPVAIGSSVPVCPTRRSPSTRRTSATTSNEVMPPGLSMTTTPFIARQRLAQALEQRRARVGERAGARSSRPPRDGRRRRGCAATAPTSTAPLRAQADAHAALLPRRT